MRQKQQMILSPEMNHGERSKQWSNGQTFFTDVRSNFNHYKAVVREVFVYSDSTPKRKQCPLTRYAHHHYLWSTLRPYDQTLTLSSTSKTVRQANSFLLFDVTDHCNKVSSNLGNSGLKCVRLPRRYPWEGKCSGFYWKCNRERQMTPFLPFRDF